MIITEVHYNHMLCKQTQGWTFKVLEMLVFIQSVFFLFCLFFGPRRPMEDRILSHKSLKWRKVTFLLRSAHWLFQNF